MTTNMVKKRVRERRKLQQYPLGLSLKKWNGHCLVPRPIIPRGQSVSVHVHTLPKVGLIDIKLRFGGEPCAAHLFVSNKATN